MRFAQLVVGPAGSGKSTYCSTLARHCPNRTIEVVNLDPAAEHFNYEPLVDVRELVTLDDVMEDDELRYGPNGGLVFCIETLLENLDWLEEKLGDVDEDYILFDCPGQLELYTHLPTIKRLVTALERWNFRLCVVFLLDAAFVCDGAKFISATMAALSVMVNLELPHINILTKTDLLTKAARKQLEHCLEPDPHILLSEMRTSSSRFHQKYSKLTESIGELIDHYSLVRFHTLNIKKEESIDDVLVTIDNILQYGEDADVNVKDFDVEDPEFENDDG